MNCWPGCAAICRASAPEETGTGQIIEVGDFRIDIGAHTVSFTARDHEVRLTPKEFDLLVYLARHPGKVVTHRGLLAAVWGPNSAEQPEYLRVFVATCARNQKATRTPPYILTEPWVGYRFEPGDEAQTKP